MRQDLDTLETRLTEVEAAVAETEARIPELVNEVLGRLRLSGFVGARYWHFERQESSLKPLLPDSHFGQGFASLYLKADLPMDFRTQVQLNFINATPDRDNQLLLAPGLFQRNDFVRISRAWLGWAPTPEFRVKAGRFHTPYGIWNIKHDAPLLPSLVVPLPVRRAIFPSAQTGVMLDGDFSFEGGRVGYAAWLGNGKGNTFFRDDNRNKAFGGRAYFALEDMGPLSFFQLGFSYYRGRVEEAEFFPLNGVTSDDLGFIATEEEKPDDFFAQVFINQGLTPWGEPLDDYLDRGAYAADLMIDLAGLRLRAEVMWNKVIPRDVGVDDFVEWGYYAYIGYQIQLADIGIGGGEGGTNLGSIEPFFRYDFYDGNDDFVDELLSGRIYSAGFNYVLNPHFQFKVENHWHSFPEEDRDFYMFVVSAVASF